MIKKRWTPEEDKLLLKIHTIYNNQELSELFNCEPKQVTQRKRRYGIGDQEYKKEIPENHHLCKSCDEVLPRSEFRTKTVRGYEVKNYQCIACDKISASIRNRERTRKKQEEKIENFKTANKGKKIECPKCKEVLASSRFHVHIGSGGKLSIKCPICDKVSVAKK